MGPRIQGHSLSLGSPSNRATGKHHVRKYGGPDTNCLQGLRLFLMAPDNAHSLLPTHLAAAS